MAGFGQQLVKGGAVFGGNMFAKPGHLGGGRVVGSRCALLHRETEALQEHLGHLDGGGIACVEAVEQTEGDDVEISLRGGPDFTRLTAQLGQDVGWRCIGRQKALACGVARIAATSRSSSLK